MTVPLQVDLYGPEGAKIAVEAARARVGDIGSVRPRSWYSLDLRESSSARLLLPFSLTRAALSDEVENCIRTMPEALLQEVIAVVTEQEGGSWDRESICKRLAGEGENEDDPQEEENLPATPQIELPEGYTRMSYSTLIRKDNCRKAHRRYLVRMSVDLGGVDYSKFKNGVELRVEARTVPYRSSTAASIKPVSDGKFAPAPLLLMTSLGGTDERIDLIQWGKDKPKRSKKIRIEGRIGYRGLVLTRSLIAPYLTGGKGTFDVSNAFQSYGVCLQLVRTRQRINGYPS